MVVKSWLGSEAGKGRKAPRQKMYALKNTKSLRTEAGDAAIQRSGSEPMHEATEARWEPGPLTLQEGNTSSKSSWNCGPAINCGSWYHCQCPWPWVLSPWSGGDKSLMRVNSRAEPGEEQTTVITGRSFEEFCYKQESKKYCSLWKELGGWESVLKLRILKHVVD